jgi:hypothetical protein
MSKSTPARKLLVCALALAVLAAPVLAQLFDDGLAIQDAKEDANRDTSACLWLGAGCLFNLLGVGVAYFVAATPPVSRLLGRPPEYVDAYTEAYRAAVRRIRLESALHGCCLGTAAAVVIGVLIAAAAASALMEEAISCLGSQY